MQITISNDHKTYVDDCVLSFDELLVFKSVADARDFFNLIKPYLDSKYVDDYTLRGSFWFTSSEESTDEKPKDIIVNVAPSSKEPESITLEF